MYYRLAFIYSFFLNVLANIENNFITTYFDFKQVSSVVGFSCNSPEDDLLLIKSLNERSILAILNKLNSETKISLMAQTERRKLGIFLDIRCNDLENIVSIFLEASEYRMYQFLQYWLIVGAELESVLNLIDDSTFSLSTEFVIAVISDTGDHQLYDVYNSIKERGTVLNVTFLGKWNQESGLNIILDQEKFQRRSNFHRIVLKVMFFKTTYKPDNISLDEYLSDYSTSRKDARSKFGYQILKNFGDLYNISFQYSESSIWEESDTLGPIIRGLVNKTADIGGSTLIMNIERSYIMRFAHEDWLLRTCFIFRNPQRTEIKADIIFRPFTTEVWYIILGIFIIGAIALAIVFHFEEFDNNLIATNSNSFLVMVGVLCQQGTDMKMKHLSTRITFLFVMIFGMLLYNYYSACTVSARLAQPIFKINDSLNELSKLNLKMASEWMVYLEYFFKVPNWEIQRFYENYWLKLPDSKKFMPPEQGIPLVQKGGFAYHTHPDVSYPLIEKQFDNQEICELTEVHLSRPVYTGFSVSYNSSIFEISKVGLTKMAEVGLSHRERTRWQHKRPKCQKDLLSANGITFNEFAPLLIFLVWGIILSIVIFTIEKFVANRNVLKITLTSKLTLKV